MTFSPNNSIGPYLPQQFTFSEDLSQLLIQLTNLYNKISTAVNLRDISIYDLTQVINGQQWFNPANEQKKRFGFRQVYNIGGITAGTTSTTPHNISNISGFTSIYGACTTSIPDYRPIPFASTTALNQQIQITVTPTNIVIINGSASPNITSCIVVLEYLLN